MSANANQSNAERDSFASTFASISPDDLEQSKNVMDSQGVKGYEEFLKSKINEWKTVPLNIGIIGASGAGKSSFINAMRGLVNQDPGAAKVGNTQTTMELIAYSHPSNKLMKLWDLPGVNTKEFPQKSYLEKIGFTTFDFFLIVMNTRFTETDLWLAREIKENGKEFFFVRTKIHFDIENHKFNNRRLYIGKLDGAKDELLKIRNDIKKNLGDLYQENKVFLIDNHWIIKYDFPSLQKRLIEDFPALKRQVFVFSMNAFSEVMVVAKIKELRSTIWQFALLSAGVAAIPLPGLSFAVDSTILTGATKFFYNQMGLDDVSLEKVAAMTGSDPAVLKDVVYQNVSVQGFLTTQGIKIFMQELSVPVIEQGIEEYVRFIPYVGLFIAGALSAAMVAHTLRHILAELGKIALEVVRTAARSASEDDIDDNNENGTL